MTFTPLHFRYATEQCREIGANTPFCILGSTQVPFSAWLLCHMDQGHGLIDRFLFIAPCCLRPTPNETKEATVALAELPLQHLPDVFLEIARLHEQHITYSFMEDAETLLHNMNEQFIMEINDALNEGTPLPKCKKVDIVQRVAVSIHIFDHVCERLLHGEMPTLPSEQVSATVLQKAMRYVEWAEDQKTIFLEVSQTCALKCSRGAIVYLEYLSSGFLFRPKTCAKVIFGAFSYFSAPSESGLLFWVSNVEDTKHDNDKYIQ